MRYKEIKEILLNEVKGLTPHAKLESRPALCKRLETTRTTLDRAIAELVGEGVLYSKDGSGTYVNSPDFIGLDGKVETWGIIVPNITETIYSKIIRGVENIAECHGINVVLCNSDGNAQKQSQYINRLLLSNAAGFIIVPTITRDAREGYRLFEQLISAKIPFVFCNRGIDGVDVPVITSNNFYGGYIATKRLLSAGYKHIAFLSKTNYKTSIDRCQGYITALIEAGISIDRDLIVMESDDDGAARGYSAALKLLNGGKKIDAFFCFNDAIVPGVLEALNERGLNVPRDVGVIGYDNSEICESLTPKLTSLAYQSADIGLMAAEVLLQLIRGQYTDKFKLYLFQPEIIERESCGKRP